MTGIMHNIICRHIFARQYRDCAEVFIIVIYNLAHLAGKPIEAKRLFFMAFRRRLALYLYYFV